MERLHDHSERRRLAALVHVADALAHEHTRDAAESPLDLAFLEEMGMTGQLDRWRELVRPAGLTDPQVAP